MILEVVDPHLDRFPAGLLAGVGADVEDLVGQQPIEPLHFAVVARRVGADSLVPAGEGFHALGEIPSLVVGTDLVQPGDAVGGEERPGPAEEPDRGHCLLIGEGLGIGQPREAVRGAVQVGVADLRPGPTLGLLGCSAAMAVSRPPATVGDVPDLLHIEVDHVSGPSCTDPPRRATQAVPVRGEVAQAGESQVGQPPSHGGQVQTVSETAQVAVDGPLPTTSVPGART